MSYSVDFFVGLHQPSDARHFTRCMISVNRLETRKSDFEVGQWIMDSGAFTEVTRHGRHRRSVETYARLIERWSKCGTLLAAAAQDWMCGPFVIERTGLSVAEHQRRTIERYDALIAECQADTYIMPVLQGYRPSEYVQHIADYGERLGCGAWVGVGSVCKRNSTVSSVEAVLMAIHSARPDLRLHGFGLKKTALQSATVRRLLATSDSMAWSYAARREGRNANDWREARRYVRSIRAAPLQTSLHL